MKQEDYLWDKTGTDAEIERLENALAVFRCQETAPPEIPAKVLTFEKKEKPRPFVRYAFAAAACVAFVLITAAVWTRFSNEQTADRVDLAQVKTPQATANSNEEASNKKASVESEEAPTVEKTAAPKQIAARKLIKTKRINAKPDNRNRTVARREKVKKSPDALTDEEKFAYNQLMLALSITGSKLRLVSDKIDNSETR